MAWSNPGQPNLTDFLTFCSAAGVPDADLPTDSTAPGDALNYALEVALLPAPSMGAGLAGHLPPYVSACYNLAFHHLLKWTPDVANETFFADARKTYHLNDFQSGVALASGDNSTSQTLVVPDLYRSLPLYAQDLLKTPWGREYLSYAQLYGSTIVGLS